jgi:hypothetical protein
MSASANSSPEVKAALADPFVAMVEAAMRRASRKVAAENKRLGLPLIVAPAKPAKRRKRAS